MLLYVVEVFCLSLRHFVKLYEATPVCHSWSSDSVNPCWWTLDLSALLQSCRPQPLDSFRAVSSSSSRMQLWQVKRRRKGWKGYKNEREERERMFFISHSYTLCFSTYARQKIILLSYYLKALFWSPDGHCRGVFCLVWFFCRSRWLHNWPTQYFVFITCNLSFHPCSKSAASVEDLCPWTGFFYCWNTKYHYCVPCRPNVD